MSLSEDVRYCSVRFGNSAAAQTTKVRHTTGARRFIEDTIARFRSWSGFQPGWAGRSRAHENRGRQYDKTHQQEKIELLGSGGEKLAHSNSPEFESLPHFESLVIEITPSSRPGAFPKHNHREGHDDAQE